MTSFLTGLALGCCLFVLLVICFDAAKRAKR